MALTVRGLRKRFGEQVALQDVNLTLHGGVVALLGANASGKSTLLRTLATLCKPDAGEIIFDEQDYAQHERLLRGQIGYLPQDFEMPDTLTPRKLLDYLAKLRGGQPDQLLAVLELGDIADQPVSSLSLGQLRLVGVSQTLLGSPRLLLLDELTRGLDFKERERVFRLVVQHGKLIIFSTHIPEDAESIAQTVVVLHQGRVLFCGALDDLRALAVGQVHELCVSSDALPQVVTSLLISRMTPQGSQHVLRVVGRCPQAEAIPVAPSLEDAYLHLTHGQ